MIPFSWCCLLCCLPWSHKFWTLNVMKAGVRWEAVQAEAGLFVSVCMSTHSVVNLSKKGVYPYKACHLYYYLAPGMSTSKLSDTFQSLGHSPHKVQMMGTFKLVVCQFAHVRNQGQSVVKSQSSLQTVTLPIALGNTRAVTTSKSAD